jgi:hypothetical protein
MSAARITRAHGKRRATPPIAGAARKVSVACKMAVVQTTYPHKVTARRVRATAAPTAPRGPAPARMVGQATAARARQIRPHGITTIARRTRTTAVPTIRRRALTRTRAMPDRMSLRRARTRIRIRVAPTRTRTTVAPTRPRAAATPRRGRAIRRRGRRIHSLRRDPTPLQATAIRLRAAATPRRVIVLAVEADRPAAQAAVARAAALRPTVAAEPTDLLSSQQREKARLIKSGPFSFPARLQATNGKRNCPAPQVLDKQK